MMDIEKIKEEIRRIATDAEQLDDDGLIAKVLFNTVDVIEIEKTGQLDDALSNILNEILKPMDTMAKVRKFLELARNIMKIYGSEASGKTKYSLIFSINKEIAEMDMSFDWFDPDSSYEEDVYAYVQALEEKVEEYKKILE